MRGVSNLNLYLLIGSIIFLGVKSDIDFVSQCFWASPALISAVFLRPSIRLKFNLLPIGLRYPHLAAGYQPGTGIAAFNIIALFFYAGDTYQNVHTRLGGPSDIGLYSWLAGMVAGMTAYSILIANKHNKVSE